MASSFVDRCCFVVLGQDRSIQSSNNNPTPLWGLDKGMLGLRNRGRRGECRFDAEGRIRGEVLNRRSKRCCKLSRNAELITVSLAFASDPLSASCMRQTGLGERKCLTTRYRLKRWAD